MKTIVALLIAAALAFQSAGHALALPVTAASGAPLVQFAALDCHAIGQRKAAELGGQLAKATPRVSGGQEVCVVVVLIPARDGKRPRRAEFVLSQ